jgi:DNA-binding NtrC family response regulator
MTAYSWPGNVRELENAILHAIALHTGDVLGPESLPATISGR